MTPQKNAQLTIEKGKEPGARRKTTFKTFKATKDTERRVKEVLDEEKQDPAWWAKYYSNLEKNQARIFYHNKAIEERDHRERQRAHIKLQRLPGGSLHEPETDNIIETVFETEAGFAQSDSIPLAFTSFAASSSSRSPPLPEELDCAWESESSEGGEREEERKTKEKLRPSTIKGKKVMKSIIPPSYSQVMDENSSLRLQLQKAQELNERIKYRS